MKLIIKTVCSISRTNHLSIIQYYFYEKIKVDYKYRNIKYSLFPKYGSLKF